MIPAAILNGIWMRAKGETQIRVLDLEKDAFTFRVSRRYQDELRQNKGSFLLHFFQFHPQQYVEVLLKDVPYTLCEETELYLVCRVDAGNREAFQEAAAQLGKEYMHYIHLYIEEEPAVLSEELTGYPAKAEDNYSVSVQEMNRKLYMNCKKIQRSEIDHGIVLETPWHYEKYLREPFEEYVRAHFQDAGFEELPLDVKEVSYLYIGNQVCAFLMPDEEILHRMLDKAQQEDKRVVFQLPPIREGIRKAVEEAFLRLEKWGKNHLYGRIEVVVNDWGMLSFLSERSDYDLTMGIFLLKTKKDTRTLWKKGWENRTEDLKKPGWMNPEYLKYCIDHYRVSRFSAESSMDPVSFPEKTIKAVTVYGPWFQMNTATLCPLYAAVCEGNRGNQRGVTACPYYCREWTFLYPEHLQMCGRYNTIWGYEAIRREQLEKLGADRVVWNV